MLWLEGRLHEGTRQPFDLADRGLLLGDGVFDTTLVLGGVAVWRAAHLDRLSDACDTLAIPFDRAAADAATAALAAAQPAGVVRLTVTRGAGPRGLIPPQDGRPGLIGSVAPLAPAFFRPLSMHFASARRNETSRVSNLKALGYLDAILAAREARAAGCDDALFLNTRGHVACATVGNIVAVAGGDVVTPPLSDGVLPGITRAVVLRCAAALGLRPVERSLTPDDLRDMNGVFVSNSLRLLAPVTRLGAWRMSTPSGSAIALMDAVARAVEADCGVDPRGVS